MQIDVITFEDLWAWAVSEWKQKIAWQKVTNLYERLEKYLKQLKSVGVNI